MQKNNTKDFNMWDIGEIKEYVNNATSLRPILEHNDITDEYRLLLPIITTPPTPHTDVPYTEEYFYIYQQSREIIINWYKKTFETLRKYEEKAKIDNAWRKVQINPKITKNNKQ